MRPFALFAASAVALGSIIAGSGDVHADDAAPTADSTPAAVASTVTVALPGVGIMVDLSIDAGGGLLDVSLNNPADYSAAVVRPNRVSFVNDAAGTSVKVKSKHGGQRIEARAGALADVSGPGSWTGDLFESGVASTVSFTVADNGGAPDITGVSVNTGDPDITSTKGETTYRSDDDDGDEMEQSATASITFEYLGQTRTMRIKVEVETEDGSTSAKMKIALSRIKGRQLADGPAVGPHTWTGQLCSGETATIDYDVADDGQITVTSTTPEAVDLKVEGRRATVSFSRNERVSIKAVGDDGDLQVGASKKFSCGRTVPTVNGDVVPETPRGDRDHDGDRRDRDHDGDRRDGDGDRDGDRDGDHDERPRWRPRDGDHDDDDHDDDDHDDDDHDDDDHDDDDRRGGDDGDRGGDRGDRDHDDD